MEWEEIDCVLMRSIQSRQAMKTQIKCIQCFLQWFCTVCHFAQLDRIFKPQPTVVVIVKLHSAFQDPKLQLK